jgi:hypothetical protein
LNFGEVAPSGNTQGWVCLCLNFKSKTQNQQKIAIKVAIKRLRVQNLIISNPFNLPFAMQRL